MRTLLVTALPPEQVTLLLAEAERREVPLGRLVEDFVARSWADFVETAYEPLSKFDRRASR